MHSTCRKSHHRWNRVTDGGTPRQRWWYYRKLWFDLNNKQWAQKLHTDQLMLLTWGVKLNGELTRGTALKWMAGECSVAAALAHQQLEPQPSCMTTVAVTQPSLLLAAACPSQLELVKLMAFDFESAKVVLMLILVSVLILADLIVSPQGCYQWIPIASWHM